MPNDEHTVGDPDMIPCARCHVRERAAGCCLDADELAGIDRVKVTRRYRKGEVVYREGDPPTGLYCIYLGGVKITKTGREGREQVMRFAHTGELFGFRSMLRDEAHSTSALALDAARICFVPRAAAMSLVQTDSHFGLRLFALLSDELRNAEDFIVELAQQPIRERVAHLLLSLRDEFGVERDGATLNVRLSRGELADTVGSATETVIRILTELKHKGIIAMKGQRIAIVSPERLEAIAVEHTRAAPQPRGGERRCD
jgi:CRP/FNR family transcriptional regulator, polysaccharide utilization system transcription regulator